MKKTALFLAVLMLFTAFAGFSSAVGESARTDFKWVNHFDASSFDPHNGSIPFPVEIYETLAAMRSRVDDDNIARSYIAPGLAESWECNEDGTEWTFHLRKGVKFHSGDEMKANDVVFSLDRILQPRREHLMKALRLLTIIR